MNIDGLGGYRLDQDFDGFSTSATAKGRHYSRSNPLLGKSLEQHFFGVHHQG